MSGFVSIIPPLDEPQAGADVTVKADGWFPQISLNDLRVAMQIDLSVTDARLKEAARAAMITIGNVLADWQAGQLLAGHETLADVPATTIDEESRLVLAWRRAIYATARAEVLEGARDYDATASGDRKVDVLNPAIGALRRDAAHAVRDILGRRRTAVDLI